MDNEDLKQSYRQRLKNIIAKKIKTTMIFPLGQFEAQFGYMWGHGKSYNELTDEERDNRDKWQECRKKILDNGHRQIKNACTELNMHDVIWHRYNVKFVNPPVGTKDKA